MSAAINVGRIKGFFCGLVYFRVFPARFRGRPHPFGAAASSLAPGESNA